MPAKTTGKPSKPSIEELEAKQKAAKAALLRAEADLLELQDQLEDLQKKRGTISVRQWGSRTEALRALEKLDTEANQLSRSIALSETAVTELERDLEQAETALAEHQEEEQEARERREREQERRRLLDAEDALHEAREKLAELPGRPSDRVYRRIATVLGPWFPPNHRPVIPEPPLARRSQDDA